MRTNEETGTRLAPEPYHDAPSPFKAALIASAAFVSALANICE